MSSVHLQKVCSSSRGSISELSGVILKHKTEKQPTKHKDEQECSKADAAASTTA